MQEEKTYIIKDIIEKVRLEDEEAFARFSSEHSIAVTGQDDAAKAQWFPIDALPLLAFDHEDIMQDAINVYKKGAPQGL